MQQTIKFFICDLCQSHKAIDFLPEGWLHMGIFGKDICSSCVEILLEKAKEQIHE